MRLKLKCIALVSLFSLFACSDVAKPDRYYILAKDWNGGDFVESISKILVDMDFQVKSARSTGPKDGLLYVVDANSKTLRVWLQNVPLSNSMITECGFSKDLIVDPNQFSISLFTTDDKHGDVAVNRFLTNIELELRNLNLQIADEYVPCDMPPGTDFKS